MESVTWNFISSFFPFLVRLLLAENTPLFVWRIKIEEVE